MPVPSWVTRIRRHLSLPGLAVGTLCFALALTPSLIPRTSVIQGILSGCLFAIGYAIGATLEWGWYYLGLKPLTGRPGRWVTIVVAAACAAVAVFCLYKTAGWQNAVRAAIGAAPVDYEHAALVVLVAVVPAVILIVLGTLITLGVQSVARPLARIVPPRVAFVGGVVIVAVLAGMLFSGVLLRGALRAADAAFEQLDNVAARLSTDPLPDKPLQSGSAQSLVAWDTIGRDGRIYVETGPVVEEIEALSGRPAIEPLRIFVGLRSAPTTEARAELALAEMQRVGAFDRSVLVVSMPVGTGWVDPAGIDTLEVLLGGDVATVALQYSYLPSPLSLVIEPDYGTAAAEALFNTVYHHWRTLPPQTRPRLYLNGLSLGAHASQASTQLFDVLADPFDGALWVGPPFTGPVWRWATANREPGSPAWLPRVGDASSIRFTNQGNGLVVPGRDWGPMRIAFLQYASDPIVFFEIASLYREPDWMSGERGPGVSAELTWYPVVTFMQLGMDMALSLTSPLGHGHVYAPADYVDAWMALIEPEGWDADSLGALKEALTQRMEAGL